MERFKKNRCRSLLFAWQNLYWPALITLISIGIIDLVLVYKKEDTISNWIHSLFPKQIDYVIMVGILVFTWFVWGPVGFLPMMLGVIFGHLFWTRK